MSQYRKDILANNEYYHIYNRSIAKYIIFNNAQEYSRMLELINILLFKNFNYQYSQFKKFSQNNQKEIIDKLKIQNDTLVDIICYCVMPTHFHLLLKQNVDHGITKYIGKLSNSYSKYFNTIHQRSGPLWASRFKNIRVEDDKQLLHLTRYIHLNPASAGLVNNAQDWKYSTYGEFLGKSQNKICKFKDIIDMDYIEYKKFVDDRKNYQQQLSQIKNLVIDNYTG